MKQDERNIEDILERSLPSLSKEQLESSLERIFNRVLAQGAADGEEQLKAVVDLNSGRKFGGRRVIVAGAFAAAALLLVLFTQDLVPNEPSMENTGLPVNEHLRPEEVHQTSSSAQIKTENMQNPVPDEPSWVVTGLPGTGRLRPGQTLQTDSSSSAQIKVANIGRVTLDPNTRIRLLVTHANEHRIALDRGKLEASISAPPRLFVVETPSADAVDLGCKYTLEVQDDGSSLLHVLHGLVALEGGGRETVVPAGAFCRTRPGVGPGTPFLDDSSTELQSALGQVDSLAEGPERMRQLEIVLQHSRVPDALSRHLIPKLDSQSRGLLYDRLAQLRQPPPGVTRDGIIALDTKMLDAWKKLVPQLRQKKVTQ